MKKLIFPTVRGVLIVAVITQQAWAVYPPPSWPREEEKAKTEEVAKPDAEQAQRIAELTNKLEEKERALALILKDLQRDELLLRKSAERSSLKPRQEP